MITTQTNWHTESVWSYCVSVRHGESRPTFLVLGKRSSPDQARPILCSGYVRIVDKSLTPPVLGIVINEGIIPSVVEHRIIDDARSGNLTGPMAAISRWRCLMGIAPLERIARS